MLLLDDMGSAARRE
jgi:hypothetical protein